LLRNETLFTPPIGITERLFTVGKGTSQTALGAHHEQLGHRYTTSGTPGMMAAL
jgi:hypothetical protein